MNFLPRHINAKNVYYSKVNKRGCVHLAGVATCCSTSTSLLTRSTLQTDLGNLQLHSRRSVFSLSEKDGRDKFMYLFMEWAHICHEYCEFNRCTALDCWLHTEWLQKSRLKYDTRKFYFTNRVVDQWNSLPNWMVTANNTKIFKKRLDQYWQRQDIIFDFRAQIEGTGSCSEVSRVNIV